MLKVLIRCLVSLSKVSWSWAWKIGCCMSVISNLKSNVLFCVVMLSRLCVILKVVSLILICIIFWVQNVLCENVMWLIVMIVIVKLLIVVQMIWLISGVMQVVFCVVVMNIKVDWFMCIVYVIEIWLLEFNGVLFIVVCIVVFLQVCGYDVMVVCLCQGVIDVGQFVLVDDMLCVFGVLILLYLDLCMGLFVWWCLFCVWGVY